MKGFVVAQYHQRTRTGQRGGAEEQDFKSRHIGMQPGSTFEVALTQCCG